MASVKVFLPEETVRRIDATRGLVPRSTLVRHYFLQAFGEDGQTDPPLGVALPEPRRRPKLRDGGGAGR
jgi:hypothetical protein